MVRNGSAAPVPQLTGTPGNGVVQLGTRSYSISGDDIQVSGWERPVAQILSPLNGQAFTGGPQVLNIQGTVTSPAGTPIASVEVFVNGNSLGQVPVTNGNWSATTAQLPRGAHEIRVRATDANAEWSEKTIQVSINQTVPPEITVTAPASGASLPAEQPFVLRGVVSDAEGSATSVQVYSGSTLLGTAPVTSGRWIFTVPATAFPIGKHVFTALATDASGDTGTSESLEVRASRTFSQIPIYGDLAYWTPFPGENRVSLANHDGDLRWYVEPSLGYVKRNADMYLANTSFDGDFRLTFRAKLVSGLLRVWFGNQVYLTLGSAGNMGSMQYVGWGDKRIGDWQQPFFPDNTNWYDVEISRIGSTITIKRNGTTYIAMTLNNNGTMTLSPDIVTEDLIFGWREKYQWYKGFWGGGSIGSSGNFGGRTGVREAPGIKSATVDSRHKPLNACLEGACVGDRLAQHDPEGMRYPLESANNRSIGIGAPFADGTSFYMDDLNVEVLSGNLPPAIALSSPASQSQSSPGAAVNIAGTVQDPEGSPVVVDLFAGSEQIASGVPVVGGEWSFSWVPPQQTVYGISARATDNRNNSTKSNTATLVVGSGNTAPWVNLTRPVPGAGVTVSQDTQLMADAGDSDGAIVSVKFFVNGALVATDTTAPYAHTWRPSATGNYTVKAEALDDMNSVTTTAEIPVVVTPSNTLPTASLSSPNDLTRINLGSSVNLAASASDSGGTVAWVEFYDNGTLVGSDTTSPYGISYTPTVTGARTIMAVAIDNVGGAGYSATRTLFVTSANNAQPTAAITSPADGTALVAPLNSVLLTASASDPDGSVFLVEFFAGATRLGEDRTAPYEYTWANVNAGTYSLTARVTDNEGIQTTSAPSSLTLSYISGTQQTFQAAADTYVLQGNATNFGTSPILRTQDKTWSYLRFPVSIPAASVLRAARVRLVPITARDKQQLFYLPDDSWTETVVNGNNGPSKGTVIVQNFTTTAGAPVEFDITHLVQQEIAGNGLLSLTLGAAGDQYSATDYHSKESLTATSRPQVIITYNQLPTVTLNEPAGALEPGRPVTLSATAADADGTVASVVFYADGVAIGDPATVAPYEVTWTPAAPGTYTITAVVTDNLGDTAEDEIEVTAESLLPDAPALLSAEPASSTSIQLSWTPPATPVSSYQVLYRLAGGNVWANGPSLAGSSSSGAVTGLAPETAYEFQLVSVAGGQSSGPSNTAAASTFAETFSEWIDRHNVGGMPGPMQDADGDGILSILEFALGTDPADPTSLPQIPEAGMDAGGEALTLTFRPANTHGLRYFIQASEDLITWDEEYPLHGLICGEDHTFTDPILLQDVSSKRRFLRLRVDEAP